MSSSRPEWVFVTGASGYVGRAVVEALGRRGLSRVALTRGAVAPLRPNERWLRADLANWTRYLSALASCDVVVHLAWTGQIRDTEALLDAAIACGVRRFVHMSTWSVHGPVRAGRIDEAAPFVPTTDPYTVAKRELESCVLARAAEIEIVVLRPTNVYGGPHGGWWSGALVDMMRRGAVLLPDFGRGTANLIHVDDLAEAVVLAVERPRIAGEVFLVSDGVPIRWGEYFDALERRVGRSATVRLSVDDARRQSRRLAHRGALGRLVARASRQLLGRPLTYPLSDDGIDRFACSASVSITKARRQLGFEPQRTDALLEIAREPARERNPPSRG